MAGSEGGRAEKDQNKLAPRRTVDPTRTVRSQFLVELARREVADLAELNGLFAAWVESVYHQRVHSQTGQRPIERFMATGAPRLPSPELLREAFLWQQTRMVTKTATVSLHGNQYEVDAALVGHRCELIFDPFDLTTIEVRYQSRPLGLAVPVRIARHTHPQARHEPAPPAQATGIDYLGLIRDQRERELREQRIDYRTLGAGDNDNDNDNDEENRS